MRKYRIKEEIRYDGSKGYTVQRQVLNCSGVPFDNLWEDVEFVGGDLKRAIDTKNVHKNGEIIKIIYHDDNIIKENEILNYEKI